MMDAVDKADSAQFTEDEILDPKGWMLLTFLMDPRTGLGRFREFRISNYQLMMELIDACTRADHRGDPALPDVAERVDALPRARRPRSRADQALRARSTGTSSCSTSATRRPSTPTTAS